MLDIIDLREFLLLYQLLVADLRSDNLVCILQKLDVFD